MASAILHIDAVMVAFGLRWASPEAPITTEQPPPTPAPETLPSVPSATPEPPVVVAVPVEVVVAAAVATEPEQPASAAIPPEPPEASADLPKPAVADGVVEAAELSNDVAGPPRMPSDADLDSCIKASAAGSKDRKTSGRQLRTDAPPWFAKNHIRPVTQADMERRLSEKNAALRRGTGKRRGSGEVP